MPGTLTIRRRSQRGSNFAEMGLILIPFLALIYAFVDYGLLLFIRGTFQHAVREGARYAVTFQTQPGMGHDASIKSIVQTNSIGFLNGTAGAAKIFIRYYDPVTLVETANNWPGNVVEISVENYTYTWIAPLWRSTTPYTIVTRSSDRMEGLPGGVAPPAR